MKRILFIFMIMFVLNFSSCIRVTHYDGKEEPKKERVLTAAEKERAENGKIALAVMFLIIFGPIALMMNSDNNGPSGGPAG